MTRLHALWRRLLPLIAIAVYISLCSPLQAQLHGEVLTGTLREFIVEHTTKGDSRQIALVTDSTKIILDTRDVSSATTPLIGRTVRVIGYRERHEDGVPAFRVTSVKPFASAIPTDSRLVSYHSHGRRSLAVVLVAIKDLPSSCSQPSALSIAQEATAAIHASTFGKIDFRTQDEAGSSTIFGPVTIDVDTTQSTYFDWEQAAREKLNESSIDLTPFQHVTFIFPYYGALKVSWAGLAWQNCATETAQCSSYLSYCSSGTLVHEFGHELGLVHSARDWDSNGEIDPTEVYSDSSTPMGSNDRELAFTSFQRDQLGVYDRELVSPHIGIRTSGQYTVLDANIPQSRNGASPIFRVYFPKTRELFYFSHHDTTNRSTWFHWDYGGGLNIHKLTFSELYFLPLSQYTSESLLLAKLLDGDEYTDDAQQFTVKQVSSSSESTTFEFTFLNEDASSKPTISLLLGDDGEVFDARSQHYGEVVAPEHPFHAIERVELFLNGSLISTLHHFSGNRFPFYLNPVQLPSGAVPHGPHIDTIATTTNTLRAVAYDLNGVASEPVETTLNLSWSSWQNPKNTEDVTQDGVVDYADISAIQQCIFGDAQSQVSSVALPAQPPEGTVALVDVDGDGRCSDADIRRVAKTLSLTTDEPVTTVMGQVRDSRGAPVKGVVVYLTPHGHSTVTDKNGNYLLFPPASLTTSNLIVKPPRSLFIDFAGSGYPTASRESGVPFSNSTGEPIVIHLRTTSIYGDIDGDKELTPHDIDTLKRLIVDNHSEEADYDLNYDTEVDIGDISFLIENIIKVPYGDINFDRCFDSSDLILAFQGGAYESIDAADEITWSHGDFNHDGRFDSGDLVFTLQKGSYPFCAEPLP